MTCIDLHKCRNCLSTLPICPEEFKNYHSEGICSSDDCDNCDIYDCKDCFLSLNKRFVDIAPTFEGEEKDIFFSFIFEDWFIIN